MKIFVTGITGFIGSNLVKELLAEGHQVNALVRNPHDLHKFPGPNLQLYSGDLENKKALRKGMEGCDKVFHLAAFAKPWSKDMGIFYKINVEGSVNVFEAARESGVGKVVFTSSAATISPSMGLIPSDEATPRKIPFYNEYESSKSEAEKIAVDFSNNGLPVVIVNPSRVYGPGPLNASNSVTKMINGYCTGKWRIIPGDGKKIGNYVFIDDVVRGHKLAAEKGRAGERYILGGQNLSFEIFFSILGKLHGKRRKMIYLPLFLMKTAARFLEFQNVITGIPPVITAQWVTKYLNDWCLSSAKAEQELGYLITPFDKGARKTMDWLSGSI
jgi:farnesol dehydrogenase